MRVSQEVKSQKEMFAFNYWKEQGEKGNAKALDAAVKEKFGHGLGLRRLYEIRKDANKGGEATPPRLPKPTPINGISLKGKRECPKCHTVKDIEGDFGLRNMGNGVIRPQAWCRDCRSVAAAARYKARKAAGPSNKRRRAARIPTADRRRQQANVTVTQTNVQGEAGAPGVVLVAANALLDAMRKNRVESISIHSSGSTSMSLLKSESAEIHFGGRRASDPAPTVSLPN